MRKNKRQLINESLINKMFVIAGHQVTYDDIKDRKDNWYQQWTMTEEQNKEWRSWGIDLIKKELRSKKLSAEKEMAWFDLNYGLKIKYDENK